MSSRLDRITDWIVVAQKAHYSLRQIESLAACSSSHLRRYFLTKFGKSPQIWLNELRLAEASHLLLTTTLTIKEIAARLSFSHSSNFCREFKIAFGCSPTQFITAKMSVEDNKESHMT